MVEEETLMEVKEKPKKDTKSKKIVAGAIIKFTGPEGAPKIVALIAALLTILTGSNLFWQGVHNIAINILFGSLIFYGIMLCILGVALILILDILDFGKPRLKKIEEVEKFFRWEVLVIFFFLILLFEALSLLIGWDPTNLPNRTRVLSSLLVLTATILEYLRIKDYEIQPSKLVAVMGIIFTLLDIALLITIPIDTSPIAIFWDTCVGIAVIIFLSLSMVDAIKFIPYQWWMVLILGFIIYGWVGQNGGSLILISFILMLLEK
ncbi:MAG: hypothetical protein ACFFBP_16075 [Promethearchaeota archaeon]